MDVMDPGTIIHLVELCYSLGVKVIEICSTWKHAEKEVEKRVLIVQSCWNRTKRQVEFVVRIASTMDSEQHRLMDELLNQLMLSLSLAINSLEAVARKSVSARSGLFGFGSKAKAAWVWRKDALDGVISELEDWQRRFDPSWFLLMKIASPVFDSELAKAKAAEAEALQERVQGPATVARNPLALAAGLRGVLSPTPERAPSIFLLALQMEWVNIPFSEAKAGRRRQNDKWYIVDTVRVGETARVRNIARDVDTLATKLSQADPLGFGLLNCKGVIAVPREQQHSAPGPRAESVPSLASPPPSPFPRLPSPSLNKNYSHFQIVFRIPRGMEVLQSLRQLLLSSDAHLSLSQKLHIARELSKAVNYVHTFAFVHKNVRPESVLYFEGPQAKHSHAFLVGFDAFRAADAGTLMKGDMSWSRNIYRHPRRQGLDPSEKYSMHHDIYSLGVCLLEIGLWESFVEYTAQPEDKSGTPQPKFGKTYHDFIAWSEHQVEPTSFEASAFQLKDFLVEQAATRLAPRMGDKYAQVVMSCLTCLDEDNEDFSAVDGASEDLVAVQFIETIMKKLDKISL
ncbi:hypothetical protein BJX61DRAFT_316620 [Aspergillus egyptiacus]|nr:hypothetical protein BJX61DRAFT_316620 [Aspergillus egyptiacus]